MTRYLTSPELAARVGVSLNTLSNWRVAGQGPPFLKPGGTLKARVRYRLEDIEAWEQANMHQSTGTCG